jgi:hypothetical protein
MAFPCELIQRVIENSCVLKEIFGSVSLHVRSKRLFSGVGIKVEFITFFSLIPPFPFSPIKRKKHGKIEFYCSIPLQRSQSFKFSSHERHASVCTFVLTVADLIRCSLTVCRLPHPSALSSTATCRLPSSTSKVTTYSFSRESLVKTQSEERYATGGGGGGGLV